MTRNLQDPSGPAAFAAELIDESDDPVDVDTVMHQLQEAGYEIDRDDLVDALVDDGGIWWINDHLLRPCHVLPRRVLTHRITAEELAGGHLDYEPDLHLLTLDESRTFDSNLGRLEDYLEENGHRLIGPAGWLGEFAEGSVVAIRWLGDGELSIEPAGNLRDGALEARALRSAMEKLRDKDDVADLLGALVEVCDAEYLAFAAAPPLRELLDRAGLCFEGDQIADSGFDWLAMWGARRSAYAARLAEEFDLEDESAEGLALLRVSSLWDDPVARGVDLDACADALRDPDAVEVFLEGFWGRFDDRLRHLRTFAQTVLDHDADCAGAHMILARVAEAEGDALGHSAEVGLALRIDPHFPIGLADRAWVRADSGDARAAIRDLERYDEQDEHLDALDTFALPGPMTARRNDACPCGSELKHKLCCGPHNGYPLALRTVWLYEKALWFASRPAQHEFVASVLAEAAEHSEDFDVTPGGPLFDLLGADRTILEQALFGRGLVQRFYEERRLLLPADEAELLRSWAQARYRLLRVDAYLEDAGVLTFTDVLTGDRVAAHWHGPEDPFEEGAVVASFLLHDGTSPTLLAWSRVADESVAQIRTRFAAGDDLALIRTRFERAREALATTNVVAE